MQTNRVAVFHWIQHPPAIDLQQREHRAVIDAACVLQAVDDSVDERAMSDRFAELSGLAVFEIGVDFVEIAGQAGEVDDVRRGDRARRRNEFVADFEIIEIAATRCRNRCHCRTSDRMVEVWAGLDQPCALARMTVQCEDRIPPSLCTMATSAPSTWRGPSPPPSWRTASTMPKRPPAAPAWACDNIPPWVLTGSSPPIRALPSAKNAPPSPRAQKPSSSNSMMGTIVKQSYSSATSMSCGPRPAIS